MVAAEQCLYSMEDLPFSSSAPTDWGWTRGWEVTQSGQQAWTAQRDIQYKVEFSNKNCGRRQGLGFFPSLLAAAQGLAEHWAACGRWWVIYSTLLLGSFFSSLLVIKLFLSLVLSIPSPIPLGCGSGWVPAWVLSFWLASTHNKLQRLNDRVSAAYIYQF